MGRVKNNDSVMHGTNDSGYRRIGINNKKYFIHDLVGILFIENPNKYPKVNHKDGNKSNNIVNNLEWTTSSGNTIHAINNGLQKNVKKVINFDTNGNILKVYNSAEEAARELKISPDYVRNRCKGKSTPCITDLLFKYVDSTDDLKTMKVADQIKMKYSENSQVKKRKNPKQHKISIYDKEANFIETLNTIVEVSKKYNVDKSTIAKHCLNIVKRPRNYTFKYAN